MFVNLRQSGQPAIRQAVQPAIPQAVQRGGLRSSPFFKRGIIQDSSAFNQWLAPAGQRGGQVFCTLRCPTWQKGRGHEEIAVRAQRNKTWALSACPVGPVGEKLIQGYWGIRLHRMILATIRGILASNEQAPGPRSTHRQGDLLWDVSLAGGGAYLDGVTNLNTAYVANALSLVGKGVSHGITDVMMHSKIFDSLLYDGEIDVRLGVGQFLENLQVTVDDGVGNPSPGVFDTYFFGPGLLEFGEATPYTARKYMNSLVIDYVLWSVHPMGHGFQGIPASLQGGPTNLELAHADSWRRTAALREHIPFACLRTREF